MSRKSHLDRTIYTDGSNGIVRLPPLLWQAFYNAALYLEFDSTQECFIAFLMTGGIVHRFLDFVAVVEHLEKHPPDRELLKHIRKDYGQ